MSNDSPQGGGQEPGGGLSLDEQVKRSRKIQWLGIVLLVLAAVAAFLLGRLTADADGAREQGFDEGEKAALLEFTPGRPKYEVIYNRGFGDGRRQGARAGRAAGQQEGRRVGFEQGEERGRAQGDAEGIQSGATTALNFSDWQTGAYYIVTVAEGTDDGVPFQIQSREQVEPGQAYQLCEADPDDICAQPAG